MKNLFKYLFLMVISCSVLMSFVNGMEKDSLPSKTQKAIPKKDKKSVRLHEQLLRDVNQVQQLDIRALLANDNVDDDIYIDRLHKLANICLFHGKVIHFIKEVSDIIPVLHELEQYRRIDDTPDFVRGVHFVIPDETMPLVSSIKDCEVRENDATTQQYSLGVETPESHALIMQLAPLWNNNDVQDGLNLCEKFVNHTNEEVKVVARMAKHWFLSNKVRVLYNSLPVRAHLCSKVKEQLQLDSVEEALIKTLRVDERLAQSVGAFPLFKEVFDIVLTINDYYHNNTSFHEDAISATSDFCATAKRGRKLCNRFDLVIDGYESFYKKVCHEINRLIEKKCGRGNTKDKKSLSCRYGHIGHLLLGPVEASLKVRSGLGIQNSLLPVNAWHENTVVDAEDNKENDNDDWLPGGLKKYFDSKNKSDKQKNTKKKKKNRKNNRIVSRAPENSSAVSLTEIELENNSLHIAQLPQSDELKSLEQRVTESPQILPSTISTRMMRYAQRVMRWFDTQTDDIVVTQASDHDVLYHSFPLITDRYIFSFGIQTPWQNQTVPHQIDTNYSLGGEILYPNGGRKTVVFTCCKDIHGICYHREFKPKKSNDLFNEYFKDKKWQVDFPPLSKEENILDNISTYNSLESDESYIEYEDSLCVRIKDIKNNVIIILYKP